MTFIAYRDGAYACFTTTDGIRRRYLGCAHGTPRQAIRHTVTDPYVSPLRESGMATPVTPLAGSSPSATGVVLIPEPRRRGSRRPRQRRR